MAESNRAEHQHKVEEIPSKAILRHNKLSNNCRGDLWSPVSPLVADAFLFLFESLQKAVSALVIFVCNDLIEHNVFHALENIIFYLRIDKL